MRLRTKHHLNRAALSILIVMLCSLFAGGTLTHAEDAHVGGGYAVTDQYPDAGYTAMIYDASNGLPTSDANFILADRDGYIWIGGYAGIIRYDGTTFTRLDASSGLTNGRGLFEDSKGRIWAGTNDSGVVVIDGSEMTHLTYKEGLPSSSIRVFAEDKNGNVYIGTTAGVCYADTGMKITVLDDERLNEDRVLRLDSDIDGTIYGQTKNGYVFGIRNREIFAVYSSEELGTEKITSILADPKEAGMVYICTETDALYHGKFGDTAENMERISVAPLSGIHWISYDCDRIWAASTSMAGFLDETNRFHLIDDLPMNSGIEMMTSDYQGNMWFASSTQGVMKIVTNSFVDMTKKAGLAQEVANVTCLHGNDLYIGTDHGLRIIDGDGNVRENELTEYIGDTRVRCIIEGNDADLWVGTYTNGLGLIHFSKEGKIAAYTKENGMPDNEIRCIAMAKDGRVLAGTNVGLAVIRDNKVVQTVNDEEGIENTVFLTLTEADDGSVYVGTDGDGIYVISDSGIRRIGRDDGLTSDVVMRIRKDDERGVYWLVTSNSIEYMKDGKAVPVTTFPYNNNYDLYFDSTGGMWIISSYGLFAVNADSMFTDNVQEYRTYTLKNGLSGTPTSLSVSAQSEDGFLYIPERNGVCRVNIDHFTQDSVPLKVSISSIYCDEDLIVPDPSGTYTIPASDGRIGITAAVLDYSLLNPEVQVYLEGKEEDGVDTERSNLVPLVYTGLPYGDYTLHIKVLDSSEKTELLDETFRIVKQPRFLEQRFIQVLILVILALAAGFIVWRIMKSTVISRQYKEIKQAKEEAEKANMAKSRFLANMSRELRTPVNTIMGVNEMALREDPAGVPKPYLTSMMYYASDIRNASESLLYMINDLLNLSGLESGKMHLVEMEYDTQELLRPIISMTRIKGTEKELRFDVDIDEALPRRLYGDAGKIRQILSNLLSNAVKYTDFGGFVLSVSMTERTDDVCKIRYSVKDTGVGISEDDIKKLFTVYERLEEEESSSIHETGLGLGISKRLSEMMGGSLECVSEYGKGSEFILTLDQKITDKTPIGVFTENDDAITKGTFVPGFISPDADILVADPSEFNLNLIRGLLKPTKVFVSTASSGEECLEKIKDTKFNVVFLDHMMAGMDSDEIVEQIRKDNPDLPVYALTDSNTEAEEFYISKGFNGYLARPVNSEALERIIMKHLPDAMMERK